LIESNPIKRQSKSSIVEIIGGERLSTKSSTRLSIWDKSSKDWQLIALANLSPV
jgi:hypothetical protein